MGTTAEKLTYLSTTKNDIKESINLTNINITNEPFRYYAYAIKKGIINVLNDPKEIWNNFEKVTGEGTSIELTSTENAPIEINLKGNTSQDGDPTPTNPIEINVVSGDNTIEICGKNLFNVTDFEAQFVNNKILNDNGVEVSDNQSKYSKYMIFLRANTTYHIKGWWQRVYYFDENKVFKSRTSASDTKDYNYTPTENEYIEFQIRNAFWSANKGQEQVEIGNTATTYEPYTGQSQLISLGVENLFDKDNVNVLDVYMDTTNDKLVSYSGNKSIYVSCKPNTTYTISKTPSKRFGACYTETTPANNVSIYGKITNYDGASITITTGATAQYLVVWLCNSNISGEISYQTAIDTLQIEVGSKKNSYSPYGTTPIELNKIGNYQDYFYKTDKWYLHKEIGKVVLDGSESNWNYDSQRTRFHRTITDMIVSTTETSPIFSNYYRYITFSDTSPNGGATSYYGRIYLYNYDYTTTSDLQTWLQSHNTIVYYILATPTNTEITDSTLIYQLEKTLYSYNGQTNISQTNNDLPFILDVNALKQIE